MAPASRFVLLAASLLGVAAFAQLAPTGSHYAARSSDTGFAGHFTNFGGYAASIPLDLPPARGGLPLPLQVVLADRTVGAAGLGWDIPLSYLRVDRTFAGRRPKFGGTVAPEARERVTLSLLGQSVELFQKDATSFIARVGTLELQVRPVGTTWQAADGVGRVFTFTQPDSLASSGLWLLSAINGMGDTEVRLRNDVTPVSVPGGTGVEITLGSISYNSHPNTGCFKHVVTLDYSTPSTTPLALTLSGDVALVKRRVLLSVDVGSRESCAVPAPTSLRQYVFAYGNDPDTGAPRLQRVQVVGKAGTVERTLPLPVASYKYGTATTPNGHLRYELTQSIALPTDADPLKIAGTGLDASYTAPSPGSRYLGWQNLIDVTGDGRPDFVFQKNGKLWVSFNSPGSAGGTGFGFPTTGFGTVQLADSTFTSGPLSAHTAREKRYQWQQAVGNTVNVWRQAIDVNGDGRLDIVDAAEQAKHWVVYLNVGGGTGVVWKRRSYNIDQLRQQLAINGHTFDGDYLPLSRRSTGGSFEMKVCYRWDGQQWNWFAQGFGHAELCSDPTVKPAEPEQTFTEWEFTDFNGDGYPDFVTNSDPVKFRLPELDDGTYEGQVRSFMASNRFGPGDKNRVEVAFNLRGAKFGTGADQFSQLVPIGASEGTSGVAKWGAAVDDWSPNPYTTQDIEVGFSDVNGDGLLDRVVRSTAFLGNGRAITRFTVALPGRLTGQRTHESICATPGVTGFPSYQTRGFRDLTGDGIPDYLDGSKAFIGTGTGFFGPVPIEVPGSAFVHSIQTEACNGDVSNTEAGLFDLDGDGKPEIIRLNGGRLDVYQLAGGSTSRTPEAGRLVEVNNGYDAITTIRYQSAKDDTRTAHAVPFPEIVVAAVSTSAGKNLGGALSGTTYAYGYASMVFDSAADRFVFPGYQRAAELRMLPSASPDKPVGTGSVVDYWPLTPFSNSLTKKERWLRYNRVGRVRDVYDVGGYVANDPWALLTVDSNSNGVIGVTHHEWDARRFEDIPAVAQTAGDCFDLYDPYDWDASQFDFLGNTLNFCNSHGFVYGLSREQWYGAWAPPTNNNIQARASALTVDDFGRVTSSRNDNDLFRADDDVCIATVYAAPTSAFQRVLTAVASRTVNDCTDRLIYATDRWSYDQLGAGLVASGNRTSHTVERRNTTTGSLVRTFTGYTASYDAAGNLSSLNTQRAGQSRTTTFTYDDFGLVTTGTRVDATGLPPSTSSAQYDPITLNRLWLTDPNQTTRSATYDGYGRETSTSVSSPGFSGGVLSTTAYVGFDGQDGWGRRVVSLAYTDPTPVGALGTAPRIGSTTFLDELGRIRKTEVDLGSDYLDDKLVTGARTYDAAGRVWFDADPYLLSEDPLTAYGTTFHYTVTGELNCSIRGEGPQPLNNVTDLATDRLPTCLTRSYVDHVITTEVRGPDSLDPTSGQYNVIQRSVTTGVGRPLSRSTLRGTTRLDHAVFSTDALGQLTSITRYGDPVTPANGAQWTFELDSLGQVLRQTEPQTATRTQTWSDWGELTETSWLDGSATRRLVNTYDALGRVTSRFESTNGIADAATVSGFSYDTPVALSGLVSPAHTLGRLASSFSANRKTAYGYDELGRVTSRVHTDNESNVYVEQMDFRGDGLLRSHVFQLPDLAYVRESTKYVYDTFARLRSATHTIGTDAPLPVFSADDVDGRGRLLKSRHGANTVYAAAYRKRGRQLMQEALVQSAEGGTQRLVFNAFDAVGRELSRTEALGKTVTQVSLSYDGLGRLSLSESRRDVTLTEAWRYQYDALGNLKVLNDVLGTKDAASSFGLNDPDRLCRVDYGGGGWGNGTGCNVMHDAVGNVVEMPTRAGKRSLTHYLAGGTRTVSDGVTSAAMTWDAFGAVEDLDVQSSLVSAVRKDRHYGPLLTRRDAVGGGTSSSVLTREIPAPGGGTLASHRGPGAEWVFSFGDARGNRWFTDQKGAFVQTLKYQPYGEAKSTGVAPNTVSFSSAQWNEGDALEGLGVTQLGARLYDPVVGRFLSRDPLIIPRSASNTNPYAFAANDPVNHADPTGLDWAGGCSAPEQCGGGFEWVKPWGGGEAGDAKFRGQNGGPVAAPPPAPHPSSGPSTDEGKAYKFVFEFVSGAHFGDNFDFDGLVRQNLSSSEIYERLSQTVEASQAIDEYNDALDGWGSSAAGVGDALNWACLYPGCGKALRSALGIESGDAKPVQYGIANIVTTIGTFFLPKPTAAPGLPTSTFHAAIEAAAGTKCFTAGTSIATDDGLVPIEAIEPGDRVRSMDNALCTEPVDASSCREVQLEHDGMVVKLLRSEAWVADNDIRVGAQIALETDEFGAGVAQVTKVGACKLKPKLGCLVTSTVTQLTDDVVTLHFVGTAETLEPTAGHRLWSVDRNGWAPAGELAVGERLLTETGTATVRSIERRPGMHRVFNFEVAGAHTYVVSALKIKSHNACTWGPGSFGSGQANLLAHFGRHGRELGASSPEAYAAMAEKFKAFVLDPKNQRFLRTAPIAGFTPGVVRHRSAFKYIDLDPNGLIISFGGTP